MNNIYWVGVRQSDIEDTGNLFKGSITIFGDNLNGNISYCDKNKRINHNIENKECDLFFEKVLESLCKKDDSVQFMFYNPELAYRYNDFIKQHTLCLNSYQLLNAFSNKQRSRFIVRNIVDTIPFVILKGGECYYESIRDYFVGYDEFVVQKTFSSGGEGTFHINSTSIIDCSILENDEYLVSPYIKDAISLNTHIVIFDDNIISLPSSVQIVTELDNKLLYSGADFICYEMIPDETKKLIEEKTICIGTLAQSKGYRGILGVDFLLKDKQLFFVEFNARFQASSQLVNKALYEHCGLSLQKMNLHAFEKLPIAEITPFSVKYSNYTYTSSNISLLRLKRIADSNEVHVVQTDGYFNYDASVLEDNVYLNRFIFTQNICSIENHRVLIHPNIYVEDIKSLLDPKESHFKAYIKFALLNHGVSLSKNALKLAMSRGKIKEAVFDAIDIIVFDGIHVNVPCSCKFSTLSPFTIEAIDDTFVLLMDDDIVSDVSIYFVPDTLLNKYTKSGVPYDSIINLATDRIRINPAPVCYYKKQGVSCKFCNLPENNTSYNLIDIKEVIDYCLDNVEFRHFLIGGGTYSTDKNAWEIIIEVTKYIRKRSNKDIYLMSIPPTNNDILDELKLAGITEVAFNLEMFDRVKAYNYMPGKGSISITQYENALTYSVSIWGSTGCVRSLLIYGFDPDEEFLRGIETLCKMGVEPIISIFRPLKNTAFEKLNPPPTINIISIYEKCKNIVERYSLILGPDCPMCQNNTLSFSDH